MRDDCAPYGLLQLAETCGMTGDKVDEVKRIAGRVAEEKARMRGVLKARAEAALRRLEKADPEGWKAVMGE